MIRKIVLLVAILAAAYFIYVWYMGQQKRRKVRNFERLAIREEKAPEREAHMETRRESVITRR